MEERRVTNRRGNMEERRQAKKERGKAERQDKMRKKKTKNMVDPEKTTSDSVMDKACLI